MKKIVYITAISLAALQAQAQVAVSGNLYIGSDALVAFNTNVINNESGQITNLGKVHFRDNIENKGDFQSTGTAILDGNQRMQVIKGTKELAFTNLQVSNNVNLETALRVTNEVSFRNGVVESSANSPFIFAANATHQGASDNSHIKGVVQKEGASAFEFPVGNGAHLAAFSLEQPTNAQLFTASYIANDPTLVASEVSEEISDINHTEYWSLVANDAKASTKVAFANVSSLGGVAYLKGNVWSANSKATFSEKSGLTSGVLFTRAKESGATVSMMPYPNPSTGTFSLDLRGIPESEVVKFQVLTQLGQPLMQEEGKVSELRKKYTLPSDLASSQLKVQIIRDGEQKITRNLMLVK